MGRSTVSIAAAVAAGAVATGACAAGTAAAAPESTQSRAIAVQQTPNAGIAISNTGITGAFTASLKAATLGAGATNIALTTEPASACATTLAGARVAVTWRNTATGKRDDVVFPACSPTGTTIHTGNGRISFTTTVLGKHDKTFTIAPGSGSFTR